MPLSFFLSLSRRPYLSCGPNAHASRSRSGTRALGSGSRRPKRWFRRCAWRGALGRPSRRGGGRGGVGEDEWKSNLGGNDLSLLVRSSPTRKPSASSSATGSSKGSSGSRPRREGWRATFGGTEERAIEKKIKRRKVSASQPLLSLFPPSSLSLSLSLSLFLSLRLFSLTPPSYRSVLQADCVTI